MTFNSNFGRGTNQVVAIAPGTIAGYLNESTIFLG